MFPRQKLPTKRHAVAELVGAFRPSAVLICGTSTEGLAHEIVARYPDAPRVVIAGGLWHTIAERVQTLRGNEPVRETALDLARRGASADLVIVDCGEEGAAWHREALQHLTRVGGRLVTVMPRAVGGIAGIACEDGFVRMDIQSAPRVPRPAPPGGT